MATNEIHNEHDLIEGISQGNERAFTAFVAHYGPEVEKAIFRVIQTELAVKDIAQDVFLHIWLGREKLATLESPRTWLFRIVYYRSYTWLRNQNVIKKGQQLIQQSASLTNSDVEEYSSFAETKKLIEEAVQQLSPQAKRIYLLSREENKKINEIALLLDISPQTVKNTLTTALSNMRKYLSQRGIILPAVILLFTQQ